MSNVKWIKLSTSMFDDEKIRLIEQMPDADTVLVIWVKLLAQAGKTNSSGYIFLNENIPYTDEMLSTIFNRPLSTIRLALKTFEDLGMIGIDDNSFISISNWSKHQSVDKLDRMREQNRLRQQRYRDKKALESPSNEDNVSITLRNDAEIEEELEEEIDKEHIPYAEIIKHLNKKAGKNFKSSTRKTRDVIKARWNEGHKLDDFIKVIDICCEKWKGQVFNNGQLGDTYLQPSTLFNGKFDERLNWSMGKPKEPNYEVNDDGKGNEKHTEKGGNVQLFR